MEGMARDASAGCTGACRFVSPGMGSALGMDSARGAEEPVSPGMGSAMGMYSSLRLASIRSLTGTMPAAGFPLMVHPMTGPGAKGRGDAGGRSGGSSAHATPAAIKKTERRPGTERISATTIFKFFMRVVSSGMVLRKLFFIKTVIGDRKSVV